MVGGALAARGRCVRAPCQRLSRPVSACQGQGGLGCRAACAGRQRRSGGLAASTASAPGPSACSGRTPGTPQPFAAAAALLEPPAAPRCSRVARGRTQAQAPSLLVVAPGLSTACGLPVGRPGMVSGGSHAPRLRLRGGRIGGRAGLVAPRPLGAPSPNELHVAGPLADLPASFARRGSGGGSGHGAVLKTGAPLASAAGDDPGEEGAPASRPGTPGGTRRPHRARRGRPSRSWPPSDHHRRSRGSAAASPSDAAA